MDVNGRKYRDIWCLILGCVTWSLWYERNHIKFERKAPNPKNFALSQDQDWYLGKRNAGILYFTIWYIYLRVYRLQPGYLK